MDNYYVLRSAIDDVARIMAEGGYSPATIKSQRGVLNSLLKYLEENSYDSLNEENALSFVMHRTGYEIHGFWGRGNRKINHVMKPIQNLLRYLDKGDLSFFIRSHVEPFVCPPYFKNEYVMFQHVCKERGYASATILCNNDVVQRLICYLTDNGIRSSGIITSEMLTAFLATYKGSTPKRIATVLYAMRNYLSHLKEKGFIEKDLSGTLPHVRVLRNAFIPHSWKTEDVKKLLESIDRGSPKGKRDFAILLIVVRLGLRVSDIRRLNFRNLNWSRKIITITMQKTGQTIELPLLEDIGWALIDYIKNGRPVTSCDRIFVRHRAPFDAVGENESFHKELHRYMQAAGIIAPAGAHCGLHSLRSTLARKMLEADTPLPVISETLGHRNINTTSIYLKIDIEGLRKCTLDPEEVYLV